MSNVCNEFVQRSACRKDRCSSLEQWQGIDQWKFEGDLLPPTFFQCCSESIWISFGTQKEETREEGCTVHKIKFQNDHDELNSLELCGPFTARRSVIIVIYDCSKRCRRTGTSGSSVVLSWVLYWTVWFRCWKWNVGTSGLSWEHWSLDYNSIPQKFQNPEQPRK